MTEGKSQVLRAERVRYSSRIEKGTGCNNGAYSGSPSEHVYKTGNGKEEGGARLSEDTSPRGEEEKVVSLPEKSVPGRKIRPNPREYSLEEAQGPREPRLGERPFDARRGKATCGCAFFKGRMDVYERKRKEGCKSLLTVTSTMTTQAARCTLWRPFTEDGTLCQTESECAFLNVTRTTRFLYYLLIRDAPQNEI